MRFVDGDPVNRVDVWGLKSAEDGKGAVTAGLPTADIPAPENELMNMLNEALAADSDFFTDRSACDEYVTAMLRSPALEPDDWPNPLDTTVCHPAPASGVTFMDSYADETTELLDGDAISVAMMSGGLWAAHMIIAATDSDGGGTATSFEMTDHDNNELTPDVRQPVFFSFASQAELEERYALYPNFQFLNVHTE